MDEQNKQEQSSVSCEKTADNNLKGCFKQECWKKCLAMTLCAFLGGFLAVYFVADRVYHNRYERFIPYKNIHQYNRGMMFNDDFFKADFPERQMRKFEREQRKMMRDFEKTPWTMAPIFSNPVKVKAFFDSDNNFKVVVDIKNFDKEDSSIDYKINGRKLTLSGKAEVKDKGYESDVSFSQDLILPENAKTNEASTSIEDNKWTLTIPVEQK